MRLSVQADGDGGLGLGTTVTSAILIVAILATVVYLTTSKRDTTPPDLTRQLMFLVFRL